MLCLLRAAGSHRGDLLRRRSIPPHQQATDEQAERRDPDQDPDNAAGEPEKPPVMNVAEGVVQPRIPGASRRTGDADNAAGTLVEEDADAGLTDAFVEPDWRIGGG